MMRWIIACDPKLEAIIKFHLPLIFMSVVWHVSGAWTYLQVQTFYELRPTIVIRLYFNRVVINVPMYSWSFEIFASLLT